jgi:glutamyl-tRNA synthetase
VFEMEPVEAAIWAHIEVIGISRIKAMQPLRVALSGEAGGPGLFDIIVLLGREKVLERLDRAICHIRKTS